jgi:hypothetical protein
MKQRKYIEGPEVLDNFKRLEMAILQGSGEKGKDGLRSPLLKRSPRNPAGVRWFLRLTRR